MGVFLNMYSAFSKMIVCDVALHFPTLGSSSPMSPVLGRVAAEWSLVESSRLRSTVPIFCKVRVRFARSSS
eukprot:Skav226908  [mRNA]  locus=scaffold2328:19623:19927:+ [translate_table: standard]